mmetsp:Transcript_23932/g.62729  ORF Transcript_23932/g.62729 Transcript_23932/m.62729 type:complete len:208 (+) Transcript_23932:247-870(+)
MTMFAFASSMAVASAMTLSNAVGQPQVCKVVGAGDTEGRGVGGGIDGRGVGCGTGARVGAGVSSSQRFDVVPMWKALPPVNTQSVHVTENVMSKDSAPSGNWNMTARSFWFTGKYWAFDGVSTHCSQSAHWIVVRSCESRGLSQPKPTAWATIVVCVMSVRVPSHEFGRPRVTSMLSQSATAMSAYWSSSMQASSTCLAGSFCVSKS